jgi:hypothetical protein
MNGPIPTLPAGFHYSGGYVTTVTNATDVIPAALIATLVTAPPE